MNKLPRSPFSINEHFKSKRKSILGIPIRTHSLILISTNAPHLQISTSSTRRETANLDSGWIRGVASGILPSACIWLSEISFPQLLEGGKFKWEIYRLPVRMKRGVDGSICRRRCETGVYHCGPLHSIVSLCKDVKQWTFKNAYQLPTHS